MFVRRRQRRTIHSDERAIAFEASSLARVRRRQGRRAQARNVLAAILVGVLPHAATSTSRSSSSSREPVAVRSRQKHERMRTATNLQAMDQALVKGERRSP